MIRRADCWVGLRDQIDEARIVKSTDIKDTKNEFLVILRNLAVKGHCSTNVQGWVQITHNKKKKVKELVVRQGDILDNWQHPAVKLKNLDGLMDGAVLGFIVAVAERDERIVAYSVSLQGTQKPSGLPWYARIDLDDEPKGYGLCGHPLLHCHVGLKPDGEYVEEGNAKLVGADSGGPERNARAWSPRVPLPWLYPWEALEWLLATVEPSLEPAPLTRASA